MELEQRLAELDNDDLNAFSLNSRRLDENGERQTLLAELEPKIKEYGKTLNRKT